VAEHYSTVQEVLTLTGLKPKDLGLETQQQLDDTITGWLVDIKDFIDTNRNRNYHDEVAQGLRAMVPPGIHQIALRAAGNMAAVAILRRETPIVKQEDFTVRLVDDQVFSEAIRHDLATFPPKPRFRMSVVKSINEG